MDKSFYKKEAASLQNLFEKFNAIQFTSDQNISKATNDTDASSQSKDVLIVPIILFLLIVGMIAFLTMWLVN